MSVKNLISLILTSVALTALIGCKNNEAPLTLELQEGWTFKAVDSLEWMPAQVPGTVHTDLLNLGLIKDPFYRLNEHEIQWVDRKTGFINVILRSQKKYLLKNRLP